MTGNEPVAAGGTEGTAAAERALAYLADLARFGARPGLERIAYLAERLGNPHRAFRSVHVAGTNGKGSTATAVAAALRAAGARVGLYTSPHLIRFHERIQVDGEPIDDESLAAGVERIRPWAEEAAADPAVGRPTQFEVGTALAFDHFARKGVEWAVLEVGLGGRWDATNLVTPELSVITPIGHDHVEVLGGSLEAIAAEKAGIIKPGRPVVLAPQPPGALEVLEARAAEMGSPVERVAEGPSGEAFTYRLLDASLAGTRFRLETPWRTSLELELPLAGPHQAANGATAAAAVLLLAPELAAGAGPPAGAPSPNEPAGRRALDEAAARWLAEGWRGLRWPGRLEVLRGERVILDGAHNPEGAQALARALVSLFPSSPRGGAVPGPDPGVPALFLVFGCLSDKAVEPMLQALAPLAAGVVATRPRESRTPPAAPASLAALAGRFTERVWSADDALDALRLADGLRGPRDWICVCGSLYLVGEVKARLGAGEVWFRGRSAGKAREV
ncbi:bifunctional folylpolyglutamate synthase/dihydrofolate synthase [Limnochorda pilosa]|uniref:tetrahydrofolate synthase n=1 Tax=Limnochorda pilosa TaxID=1555112 RepID=A0A0K2SNE2_LIMPI|nr:folylpolyglutamate synthase/dihydrofolate synthase family protein [Limnochorda pilosa]BAS28630.1 folylpolyglutamate synthase [Limnochorda pilosa]